MSPCKQPWSSRLSWAQEEGSNGQNQGGFKNKQIIKEPSK